MRAAPRRLAAPLAAALLAAACSGGSSEFGAAPDAAPTAPPPAAEARQAPADAAAADGGEAADGNGEARERDFPTGPAFAVRAGYEPPADRVPSTGAWLPANGRPTLVFVDAIW